MCGGVQTLSLSSLITDLIQLLLIPLTGGVWWFVTTYIALMIIAPTYNKLLSKLNSKGLYLWTLFLLFFCYTLGSLGSGFHDFEKGLFFYTLGVLFLKELEKKNINILVYGIIAFVGFVLNAALYYEVFSFMTTQVTMYILLRKMFTMSMYLFADPLCVIGVFGLFAKMSFSSNLINRLSKHTFGIYLFHETPVIRSFLWDIWLCPYRFFNTGMYVLYSVACVAIVFFLGLIIDFGRQKLFHNNTICVIDKMTHYARERYLK